MTMRKVTLGLTIVACAAVQSPLAGAAARMFVDVTTAAGIQFRHQNGAFGKKYLPETMGSGGAFLDADGDGWLDVLLINSKTWPGRPPARATHALYRNKGDGTFADVTAASGLGVEMYGMGAAAADYDNDGRVDVYITGLDGNRLFRGTGGGKFADVTARAGVAASGFSTSAAWFDYDRDGRLDLFVARYVDWSIDRDLFCTLDGKTKSYCTPESYKGQSPILYRNRGDGTFEDVTAKAGLNDPASKALGVALLDYDSDGAVDLFVANDTQPNRLYRNRGNGTFVDVGVTAGVAFNEAGVARAGMGVDAADIDGSGRPSIVIGNFSNEMIALYRNEGNGLFIDEAPASTLGRASLLTLAFGCFFFDYDLDGLPDIFAANGHVADDISRVQPRVTYAQPPHLFRQSGPMRFEAVGSRSGPDFAKPMVARGAAYGDYDRDGDLDVLVTTNNGPVRLLRNDGGDNRAVRLLLRGVASNRDAIGARVTTYVTSTTRRVQMVKTGSSYLSQSELALTVGLGAARSSNKIDIAWPSGRVERLPAIDAGQTVVIEEGRGVVSGTPFTPRPAPPTTGLRR
jgi:enediyne biosynthesis protein E4